MAASIDVQVNTLFAEVWDEQNTHIQKVLGEVGPRLADRVRETFDRKGERGGHEPWLITNNPTPLIKTGRLYRSIESNVRIDPTGFVLEIGTNVEYGKKHNEGIGVPKREFLFLTDDDFALLQEAFDRD